MTPILCRFFPTGCTRNNCKYEHKAKSGYFKKTPGCWYENTKLGCRFGENCKYKQQETKTLTSTRNQDRRLAGHWLTKENYENDILTLKNLLTATTNLLSTATSDIQTLKTKIRELEQKNQARQLQPQQSNEIPRLETGTDDNPTDPTSETDETDENERNEKNEPATQHEPEPKIKAMNKENDFNNNSDSTTKPDENSQDNDPNEKEKEGGKEEEEEEEEEEGERQEKTNKPNCKHVHTEQHETITTERHDTQEQPDESTTEPDLNESNEEGEEEEGEQEQHEETKEREEEEGKEKQPILANVFENDLAKMRALLKREPQHEPPQPSRLKLYMEATRAKRHKRQSRQNEPESKQPQRKTTTTPQPFTPPLTRQRYKLHESGKTPNPSLFLQQQNPSNTFTIRHL